MERKSWNTLLLAAVLEVRGQWQLWVLGVHVYGWWGSTVKGRGTRRGLRGGVYLERTTYTSLSPSQGCKEREKNGGQRMTHERERGK